MKNTLSQADITRLAKQVEAAQLSATPITKLTEEFPEMSMFDGYAIQLALRQRRLAREGVRSVGWKAGLTSKAKMLQMGVYEPSVGFLTSDMARPENAEICTDTLCHPRVECEVAFVLKQALEGPDLSIDDVLAATDFVLPAVEIIDSRYANFKFDLPSVLADNSSSALFVAGGRARRPSDIDLRTLGVVLEKNGEIMGMGASAAVLGHPAAAVARVVKILHSLGESLPAGSFVMSGAITEAIPVVAGDHVAARFQELGSVSMRFV